jgi:hypothetical protein
MHKLGDSGSRLTRNAAAAVFSLDRFVERYPSRIMAAILLVYMGRAFLFSRTTELQIDELLTYAYVQLHSISALWFTLKHYPPALDPPLHPVLAFFSFRLPLPFPLSFRIPAIAGYGAMMVSIFVLLRRRAPASVALTASAIPMLIPVFQYAIQARPYALVLGFSGWALVFWQRATEHRTGRKGTLMGLYLCLACVLLSHYLGALLFIPLIAGESWRCLRYRLDPAIWMVFAAAAATVISYIPLLSAAAVYRVSPWHGVIAADLWDTYLLGVAPILVIVTGLCAVLWLASSGRNNREQPVVKLREHECIAIAMLYFVPIVSFAIGKVATHTYVARYSLVFSIAAALTTAIIIYLLTNRALSSALLMFLVIYAAWPAMKGALRMPAQNTDGITASNLPVLDRLPALPIVEPYWTDYMEIYLFGPAKLKERITVVLDPALVKDRSNFSLSTEAMHRALNLPEASYEQFIGSHSQFLLLGGYSLSEQLLKDRREVRLIGKIFRWDLYLISESR